MITYNYSIQNDITAQILEIGTLSNEIETGLQKPEYIVTRGDELLINFDSALPAGDKTTLDNIVSAHQGNVIALYKSIIRNARSFFDELVNEFGAENISMGITQLGKTKAVSDYLEDVMKYGLSGSLYEVIGVIDALDLAGHPAELSPFVTTARMNDFKSKIQGYLGT